MLCLSRRCLSLLLRRGDVSRLHVLRMCSNDTLPGNVPQLKHHLDHRLCVKQTRSSLQPTLACAEIRCRGHTQTTLMLSPTFEFGTHAVQRSHADHGQLSRSWAESFCPSSCFWPASTCCQSIVAFFRSVAHHMLRRAAASRQRSCSA